MAIRRSGALGDTGAGSPPLHGGCPVRSMGLLQTDAAVGDEEQVSVEVQFPPTGE
jgi:hypothetical protein